MGEIFQSASVFFFGDFIAVFQREKLSPSHTKNKPLLICGKVDQLLILAINSSHRWILESWYGTLGCPAGSWQRSLAYKLAYFTYLPDVNNLLIQKNIYRGEIIQCTKYQEDTLVYFPMEPMGIWTPTHLVVAPEIWCLEDERRTASFQAGYPTQLDWWMIVKVEN